MKRYLCFALIVLALPFGSSADPRIRQASPAVYADLELPFRCVLSSADKQISQTISLTPDDFSFTPNQSGDPLPRYAVNGYSFRDTPVNKALEKLLQSANIKVVAPQSEYPYLDAQNVKGELSSVVAQLAEAGDVFYTYKEATKTLTLWRRTEYVLTLPKNKSVLMTMLDILRGSGIENLTVDWEKYKIRMTVSSEELQKARKLVRKILDDSYLLATDIQVYQATPYRGSGEWQKIFNDSTHLLASVGRAVIGRSVILKTRVEADTFLQAARKEFQLTPLVAGQAVVPNGWKMKFNVNECSNHTLPYPDMSVLLKTRIQNQDNEETEVTLYTAEGVLSTFHISSSLQQEIALVGVPTKIANNELLFILRFNLVRFLKKGE